MTLGTLSAALAERVAAEAQSRGLRVAVAETCCGGQLSASLAAAAGGGHWFTGGLVASSSDARVNLLGVTPGSTVTESCAREMARGARELLGADVAVAVTGVLGPIELEGKPAGTVFIGYATESRSRVCAHHFSGEPVEVLAQSVEHALEGVRALLLDFPLRAEPPTSTRPIEIIDRSSSHPHFAA